LKYAEGISAAHHMKDLPLDWKLSEEVT
jgi:hypothetical protein